MSISAPGLGSGLDVKSIVSQLMEMERKPLVALQGRATTYETQLSAYGQLKSALSTFQTAMRGLNDLSDFQKFTATSSNESILTAKTSTDATAGEYNIQVDRLAQAHRLATSDQSKTAVLGGNAGDALTVSIDNFSFTIDLSGGMTLSQLNTAINNAPGNPGVRGQVVDVDSAGTTQRLALSSPATGYAHRVELSGAGSIDPATSFGFATTNRDSSGALISDLTQLDSALSIDGISVTREENTIMDLAPGLTLNLTGAAPGKTVNLKVGQDATGITESVQAFADAYNTLMQTITDLGAGDLKGDGSVRMLQNQIRGVLNSGTTAGTFSHLAQAGLSLDKYGKMQLDSGDLKQALSADAESFAKLFANTGTGYAYKFDNMVTTLLGYQGLVQSKTQGLEKSIKTNEDDQLDMESRLALIEENYNKQYTALDSLVATMSSTSSYLTQQFSSNSSS